MARSLTRYVDRFAAAAALAGAAGGVSDGGLAGTLGLGAVVATLRVAMRRGTAADLAGALAVEGAACAVGWWAGRGGVRIARRLRA